jgi:hypothetical protein
VQGVSIADAFWFHMFASATKDNHYAPGLLATRMVFAIGYFHFSSFFGMLVSPSILKLTSAAVLEENTTLRHALGLLVSGWKSYIWLATLKLTGELFLPEMLAFWLFAATMEIFEAIGAQRLLDSGPGFIVLAFFSMGGFVLFLWVGSSLSLTFPVAALEGMKGFRALRRSWKLSRGARMRIAFTWLAVAIASWAITVGVLFLLRIGVVTLVRATHSHFIGYILFPVAYRISNTMLDAVFGPIYPIAITLFYYDQRIRHEGYDIQRMMDAAGLNSPPDIPVSDDRAEPTMAPPISPVSVEEAHS